MDKDSPRGKSMEGSRRGLCPTLDNYRLKKKKTDLLLRTD